MNHCVGAEPETGSQPAVRVEVSLGEGAKLPRYATTGAAGLDLTSVEDVELAPMERRCVNTGVRVAIPHGYEGQVRPRSGLALRLGIGLVNSVGTIDSDYRGEIGVILINLGSEKVSLPKGERIAQMIISPVIRAEIVEVDQLLRETVRGEGGFGSTGTR